MGNHVGDEGHQPARQCLDRRRGRPIGEALLATGVGIAVAIPAVLAFNYFVRRVKAVVADLDDFANDFLNLAQHAVLRVERRPQEVHRLQPVVVGAAKTAS